MKTNRTRKLLSLVLSLAMVMGMLVLPASAGGTTHTIDFMTETSDSWDEFFTTTCTVESGKGLDLNTGETQIEFTPTEAGSVAFVVHNDNSAEKAIKWNGANEPCPAGDSTVEKETDARTTYIIRKQNTKMYIKSITWTSASGGVDEDQTVAEAETAVTTALNGLTVAQADVADANAAKTAVEAEVDKVVASGITATVAITNFSPATAGTKTSPDGIDGSFDYSVALSKDSDTGEVTGTGTITATAYVTSIVHVFDAANAPATIDGDVTYTKGQGAAGDTVYVVDTEGKNPIGGADGSIVFNFRGAEITSAAKINNTKRTIHFTAPGAPGKLTLYCSGGSTDADKITLDGNNYTIDDKVTTVSIDTTAGKEYTVTRNAKNVNVYALTWTPAGFTHDTHTYAPVVLKAATCDAAGLQAKPCTEPTCPECEGEPTVIPATGEHTYGEDGLCSVCGDIKLDSYIAAVNSAADPSDLASTNNTEAKAAAAAKTWAEGVVNNENITVTIVEGAFTAAVPGDETNPDGTAGSYKFKVKLTTAKNSTGATSDEKTVAIEAAPFGAEVDKTDLNAAIAAAEAAADAITVDTDAANVDEGAKWITQADLDTYKTAIAAAKAVAGNEDATLAQVTDAENALATATAAFEAAQQEGTKTFVPPVDKGDAAEGVYVLDFNSVNPGNYPNSTMSVGTKDANNKSYFTVLFDSATGSNKNEVKGTTADAPFDTYDDGYVAYRSLNFGGSPQNGTSRLITFTTTNANATVEIWWANGGSNTDNTRNAAILDSTGKAAIGDTYKQGYPEGTKTHYWKSPALATAGEYRVGALGGNILIYKIRVTDVAATSTEYTVTVTGGTADKAKAAKDASVTVTATVPSGKVFDKWTTSDLTLTEAQAATTPLTFTMPAKAVAITATFKDPAPVVVEAESVTVAPATATLEVEDTVKLTATVAPANTTDKTVTWASSDTAVATVDATGKVTAVGVGTATITATTANGKTATCAVTVNAPTTTVTLTKSKTILVIVDETMPTEKLVANVTPAGKTVTWASDDEDVVTVAADGTITAVAAGKANVTATVDDATATCAVEVMDVTAAVPTEPEYTITVTQPTGATIAATMVSNGTDVTADKAKEGKKITVAVSGVDTGKEVKELTYSYTLDGKDVTRTLDKTGGEFNMPAANVTITATVGDVITAGGSEQVTYTFDGTTDLTGLTGAIAAGTSFGNGFITLVGDNKRATSSGTDQPAIETAKNMKGGLQFEITGTANVTLVAGSGNSSDGGADFALAKVTVADDGTETYEVIANNENKNNSTSKTGDTVTYTGLTAGTYRAATAPNFGTRGAWVLKLTIVETGGATCSHPADKQVQRNAYEKTCTTDGHTADTVCLNCGKTIVNGETIAREGHSFNAEHKCSVCGVSEPAELEIIFNDWTEAMGGYVIAYNSIGSNEANKLNYNGRDISKCVKFDSAGRMTFKAPAAGTVKFYMTSESADGKTGHVVSINGTDTAITDGTPIEMTTTAGQNFVFLKGGDNSNNTSRIFAIVWDNADDTVTGEPETPTYQAVTGVELDKATATVETGKNVTLKATVKPTNATIKDVEWVSSKPKVATVDANGKVTAVAEGTAVITVTTVQGGFTASCTVTVTEAVEEPEKADTTALEQAITAATTAKNGAKISTDGADVYTSQKWTTQAEVDKLAAAITAAQAVVDAETVAEADVTAAIETLNAAVDAFKATLQPGTKISSGNMVPTGPSGGGSASSTTTVTNDDGSKTTTKTDAKTGAVTETTTWSNGDKQVVVTAKDGTKTDTMTKSDGTKTETVIKPDGETTAKVTLPSRVDKAVVTIPVEATDGTVAVIVKADGTEQVIKTSMASENGLELLVDKNVTVKIKDNAKKFDDIADDYWAKGAVDFVSSREIFKGVYETVFAPADEVNRGMMATVLYRLADAKAEGENVFFDVADGNWYTDAVVWANRSGVVTGYADGNFGPADAITREQMAAMLFRFAKVAGIDTTVKGDVSKFSDGSEVSSWASEAMAWAVGVGLINGVGDPVLGTILAPAKSASRAEVATIMQRMVKLMMQ